MRENLINMFQDVSIFFSLWSSQDPLWVHQPAQILVMAIFTKEIQRSSASPLTNSVPPHLHQTSLSVNNKETFLIKTQYFWMHVRSRFIFLSKSHLKSWWKIFLNIEKLKKEICFKYSHWSCGNLKIFNWDIYAKL